MRTPAQADLQRWSDEVARDPRSLAFLPLARAYRRQGLRDTALQLCLRGLEAYPSHIEAHGLLAALYVERGEHEKAADEWSIVLRIDPDNFDALRGLGFCYLQQDRLSRARQMLERAALLRPADPAVDEALRMLGAHAEPGAAAQDAADHAAETGVGGPHPNGTGEDAGGEAGGEADEELGGERDDEAGPRWIRDLPFMLADEEPGPAPQPAAEAVGRDARDPAGAHAGEGAAGAAAAERREPPRPPSGAPLTYGGQSSADAYHSERPRALDESSFGYSPMADPASLFEDLVGSGPVLGALVVDAQGLVLAGRMTDPDRDAAVLGAVLGGAAFEAARTAAHLSLGEWRGITMEAADAVLHIVPAGHAAMVVLAARRGTPAGWMRRAAAQAADRAALYMEAYG